MIAPDANLLIYAYNTNAPEYQPSRRWLESILSGGEAVGIPDLCAYAFMRFVTNPKLVPKPISFRDATAVVDSWLAAPNVTLLHPGRRHWSVVTRLADGSRLRGGALTDAFIAAIAMESAATIHTNDRDFARFPGLRWVNPLL